jgi:multiple sugar transport system permease protein
VVPAYDANEVAAVRGKELSISLVTLGLLVLVAGLIWWTLYYARTTQSTRSFDGTLFSLTPCLVFTTGTCSDLETGTEWQTPGSFLADEDETFATYLQALASPDGMLRYRPWLFNIGLLMLIGGLGIAFARRDTSHESFANSDLFVAYIFILPSLVGFIVFFLYPAANALLISFHEWNLLRPPKFAGLENFQDLFTDRRFWRSLRVTLLYVAINIPIQTALALFLAVVLDRFSNALSSVVRGLMVLPWLLPPIVVGLLWLWMLDPLLGIVNAILGVFGIPQQPFLGSPDQVIPAIAGINIWQYTGYTAILFFAGLKTIPRELYHAASIDGANQWHQFWRITLPLLRPVTIFVLVTSIIGSFQVFDTVAITTGAGPTGGGPAGASSVILFYIFDKIFNRGFDMGLAAAASVALFVILITVTIIQFQFLRAGDSDLADYS